MDVLSEVLSAVRLDGAVYLNGEFTAPWCIQARYGLPNARELLGGANHIVFFHFLIEGRCQAKLADGAETFALEAGDLILVMDDYGHALGSDVITLKPESVGDLGTPISNDFTRICHGGGGEATRFVCGYVACDRRICKPLLDSLPPMFKVTIGTQSTSAWLMELLRVGVQETLAQRPGARSLLTKLSELLFVEAMRRHAAVSLAEKGWLAGLRDPYVGKAIAKLHSDVTRPWTVDALAQEVALSRSALGERFIDLIGEPPMQYLTRWRLALAARALRTENDGIARIAQRCGYESEAAFNRAFKREFGSPPAAWRKNERESSNVSAVAIG